MFTEVEAFMRQAQDDICAGLATLEERTFREDSWERPGGGGGRSRVVLDGTLLEKGGVNFSSVHGELPAELAGTLPGEGVHFQATGVSLVLHPRNPFVPTVHANFRFLARGSAWWFGGGADLTPYYPFREDVIHFHRSWKAACERHPPPVDYPRFKKWCDDYFFLAHRQEPRGVGGIFFDNLTGDFASLFAFVRDAAATFLPAYVPIVQRRSSLSFGEHERQFQQFRRGRYVEFNLIYDRGTLFGLKTQGRIESILMSLPPTVRWGYGEAPNPGSREAELLEYLPPRDWANEKNTSESS